MLMAASDWRGPGELAIVGAVVLAALVVWLAVLTIQRLRTLKEIRAAVREIQRGRRPKRLKEAGPEKHKDLINAVNRLARSMTPATGGEGFVVPGARPPGSEPEMVSWLCRELRVPLTTIYDLIETLLDEKLGPLTARQRENIMRLLANVKSLRDLMQEADDLSSIRRGLAMSQGRTPAEVAQQLSIERILLIEDDEILARSLTGYLEGVGFGVVHAETAETGIAMCQSHRPAAVVLDVLLPGPDAWYVLGELKEGGPTQDVPIVLVGNLPQKRAGVLIGADDYLVKPVAQSALLERLSRYLSPGSQASVWVVAADDPLREALEQYLQPQGAAVSAFATGNELLAQLRVPDPHAGRPMPQVVLLDLMLPDVDGFEALRQLREHPEWRKVPVVLLVAKHLETDEQQFLVEGANRLVLEHATPSQAFLEEVLDWINRVRAQAMSSPTHT